MKKEKKETAVNYDALKYLKSFLKSDVKILDLRVQGSWLKATLPCCDFSVKNRSTD